MTERIPKWMLVAAAIAAPLMLAYLAYSRPYYFTSQLYISALVLLEFVIAAVWLYRKVYFPVVIVAFLLAGMGMPGGWSAARWLFLAVGAWVGLLLTFKERSQSFGLFHAVALSAGLAAFISAAVSSFPGLAMLKALSLVLLFAYAATGVRLAVRGREATFFSGLVTGCEIFVALIAVLYVLRLEVMGNPNSLGAVMGVVGVPLLLWGAIQNDKPAARRRRLVLLLICTYLVFHSHARAGVAAAVGSSAVFCLGLRRYKLLIQGGGVLLLIVAAAAVLQPQSFSERVSATTSDIMYKGRDPHLGLFSSRETPWQATMESIHSHFWFGTGFGTTDAGDDASSRLEKLSTETSGGAEHGSSFLAILTWVGVAGVVPFLFLVTLVAIKIARTLVWMFKTANSAHPAVPLALVALAGLIHACFEDWLFAPGYYLSVFFWCLAFVLADLAPSAGSLYSTVSWRTLRVPQRMGVVAGR